MLYSVVMKPKEQLTNNLKYISAPFENVVHCTVIMPSSTVFPGKKYLKLLCILYILFTRYYVQDTIIIQTLTPDSDL